MSPPVLSAFRFATEAQWDSCLFVGADRQSAMTRRGLHPFAPYAMPPKLTATNGAHGPAVSEEGDLLWLDDDGQLQRLPYGEDQPLAHPAQVGTTNSTRLAVASGLLWAASGAGSLEAFDVAGPSRVLTVNLAGKRVLDIAADGHGGLYALTSSRDRQHIVHVSGSGAVTGQFALEGLTDASALTFLLRTGRIVVVAGSATQLWWLDPATGETVSSMLISGLRPCFDLTAIGSDGCNRLLLAGVDGHAAGGASQVVIATDDGDLLGTVAVAGIPGGLTADSRNLYVATPVGLLCFSPATVEAKLSQEVRATLLTPLLRSSAQTPQRWTRVEAEVELPAGCTIEVSIASLDDQAAGDELTSALANRSTPPVQRLVQWHRQMAGPIRTFTIHGKDRESDGPTTIVVPLHDIGDRCLWIEIALSASPGGRVPALSQLSVHYPGPLMIENLPAIYRRGEFETGNFLRGLVGVLETTSQGLDARIGDLGRKIHPDTAPPEWLDFVARWMGLPWDDALAHDQKRRIVQNGSQFTALHGTRSGLSLLLDSLMPERPRRYRITDVMADFGLVTLGGGACTGARLPAMLAGLPANALELGNKAVLGKGRLPCTAPPSVSAGLIGRIRVEMAVDAEEFREWSPWLARLIAAMLPVTAQADLRWLSRSAYAGRGELSTGLLLSDDPIAHLGTDAVTGFARLGGRARTELPDILSNTTSLH